MIRRWNRLCARRSSCLLFQLLCVETCSFLPKDQSDRRDLARQRETSHRRFHPFGKQSGVEILKGSRRGTGQGGRTLEDIFQIMVMVGVETTDGQQSVGTLELAMQETVLGTGSRRQGQTAVGPELPLGAEAMRRLDQSDQQSSPNRADAGNLSQQAIARCFLLSASSSCRASWRNDCSTSSCW